MNFLIYKKVTPEETVFYNFGICQKTCTSPYNSIQ